MLSGNQLCSKIDIAMNVAILRVSQFLLLKALLLFSLPRHRLHYLWTFGLPPQKPSLAPHLGMTAYRKIGSDASCSGTTTDRPPFSSSTKQPNRTCIIKTAIFQLISCRYSYGSWGWVNSSFLQKMLNWLRTRQHAFPHHGGFFHTASQHNNTVLWGINIYKWW